MTYIVSNDPTWWPFISNIRFASYFAVASAVLVVYDWVLTFAQEFELIWMRRWSFMTILYVSVRYIGILYSLTFTIWLLPVQMPDKTCNILYFIVTWGPIVIDATLGLIIMTRLHAMYGRSNKMLVVLAALLLVATIAAAVVTIMGNMGYSGGEAVLSGYHICDYHLDTNSLELTDDMIIPTAIWEIFAFCLAVWIVTKRFHELRHSQSQRRSAIGECLTVLIQSHALYFLAFVVVAFFALGALSPYIMSSNTLGTAVYGGFFTLSLGLQMCVLGPRLILSVREYDAKLVAMPDEETHITPIAFQAGGDVLTGGDV